MEFRYLRLSEHPASFLSYCVWMDVFRGLKLAQNISLNSIPLVMQQLTVCVDGFLDGISYFLLLHMNSIPNNGF